METFQFWCSRYNTNVERKIETETAISVFFHALEHENKICTNISSHTECTSNEMIYVVDTSLSNPVVISAF